MPLSACATRSLPTPEAPTDPSNVPPGQEDLTQASPAGVALAQVNNFALIVESVPGTVAVARFPNQPASAFVGADVSILDSDPLTPGDNGISVGSLPIAIATDRDGCYAVTANAGTCDLSTLDLNSALNSNPQPVVNRIAVTNASGTPILAKPSAMVAEPAAGVVGQACASTPQGIMYIAYPGCHLVAAVDPGTGKIVAGIQFGADGTPSVTDGNVTCPAECGTDDAPTPGPRPGSIDIEKDTRVGTYRMAIGAEGRSAITVVELNEQSLPSSVSSVSLEGDVGVLQVAISPQIGMGGAQGQLNDATAVGGQFQFVYAVATDGSVRVADILQQRHECETQADPRFLRTERDIGKLSCLKIGDPTEPRRADATGPGITLIDGAQPLSVTILGVDQDVATATVTGPLKLIGYFAVISGSDGQVYIADIDDDNYDDLYNVDNPLAVTIPLAIAHQLRDNLPNRDLLAQSLDSNNVEQPICATNGPNPDDVTQNAGGPRVAASPTRFIDTNFIAAQKSYALPTLRQVQCIGTDETASVSELAFAAPPQVRADAFPDLRAEASDETWTLTWEGTLSQDDANTAIDGPPIRIGAVTVDGTGMKVADAAHPFCSMGVQEDDIAVLDGCDLTSGNSQCPLGYTCYEHPDAQAANGSCIPTDQLDFLSGPCREYLISKRFYSVKTAESGELTLAERKHVLRTSPTTGCVDDNQCTALALYEAQLLSPNNPDALNVSAPTTTYTCEADDSRADVRNRCVETCDITKTNPDADCDPGTVCNAAGRCVESVIPPLQCVTGAQRFEVRASDAFTVIGSVSGYIHPITEDPTTHACVVDPNANPLLQGRVPLKATPCTDTGVTAIDPNPCETTLTQYDLEPQYVAGSSCVAANPSTALDMYQTSAIQFRNPAMTFNLVNPTYAGDKDCVGDALGNPAIGMNVPTAFPGMTLQFRQVDGLVPMRIALNATLPVQVTRGPQNSIWVVDEGDFLSSDTSLSSTQGKVFRFESIALGTINTLE